MRGKGIIVILLLVLASVGAAFLLTMGTDSSARSSSGAEALMGTAATRTQPADASETGRVGVAGKQDKGGNPDSAARLPQPDAPGNAPADTSGLTGIEGSVTALSSSSDSSIRISFYESDRGFP